MHSTQFNFKLLFAKIATEIAKNHMIDRVYPLVHLGHARSFLVHLWRAGAAWPRDTHSQPHPWVPIGHAHALRLLTHRRHGHDQLPWDGDHEHPCRLKAKRGRRHRQQQTYRALRNLQKVAPLHHLQLGPGPMRGHHQDQDEPGGPSKFCVTRKKARKMVRLSHLYNT